MSDDDIDKVPLNNVKTKLASLGEVVTNESDPHSALKTFQ